MANNFSHLFLSNTAEQILFTSQSGGRTNTRIPQRERNTHGSKLLHELELVQLQNETLRADRGAAFLKVRDGIYLEFQSAQNYDLLTKSLESIKSGVRLLNIRVVIDLEGNDITYATVFIPRGKETFFINKVNNYLQKENAYGTPSNNNLINSIEHIRLAILESFWIDDQSLIPLNDRRWCEIWLRINQPEEQSALLEDFISICELYDIEVKVNESLLFPERLVLLIRADREQLIHLIESIDYLSELRIGKEATSFWTSQSNIEQLEWVHDLLSRLNVIESNVTISILDTGISNVHLLLQPILPDNRCLALDSSWGTIDHHGHGTLMGGIAGLGDLQKALQETGPVEITHDLTSVKILPPYGENDPELYGYLIQQAISISEIAAPHKEHIFCSAITSEINHNGRPSSWSAAIDQITSGQIDGHRRLFIIAAGNIYDQQIWLGYPDTNLLESIQDPAQSWNAITVGAYTEKVTIRDPSFTGHLPLAPLRGLSPYSSTSFLWERKWPIKPEVVFEGGNIRKSPDGRLYENFDDFSLLSTSKEITNYQFDVISATSAAAAQAAWMAGKIQYAYPTAWPETVKGLIIHSADWPEELIQQYNINTNNKGEIQKLMRICGYGVPKLEKAIYCSNSVLTLISQETIQPFRRNKNNSPATNDMHFYDLPWPTEVLLSLGAAIVRLRITLCYFIEPGPGEVGWKDKYRYASHGLRFDLKTPNDTRDEFIRRINVAAREENERIDSYSGSERWKIGAKNRAIGSVHSDIWEGTAAEIATSNMIAIYPIIGWWRERTHLGKINSQTRYSLIVSLETTAQNVDIYTPVQTLISTRITISS